MLSVARLRLSAVCLAIALLVFAQSSGAAAADTKLDLVVDPVNFLRRSLTLWDPLGAAGQMQDQAYGYLFPMGPFFVVAKWAGLQPWIAQRLWESAILIAAFLGVVRLSRLLGMDRFWPRVASGLVYALAPRMLMELGVISSELLPAAVLPWVLIPLVRAARGGSIRRGAAMSGVALLFAGGINASATLAILPVPVLWLLTRAPGARRRALMAWFVLSAGLACFWWAIPLLLLGKYSPPFLDWIESSAVTTSSTSLVGTLRGVDHWQAYLGPNVWPGGWILASAPAAIVATTLIAAIGLVGLVRRSTPHRAFLCASLVLGLILVTAGHVAGVGPPFAGSVRQLLDGPLAAFRNIHKFDPLLRLPLSIGVGFALAALPQRVPKSLPVRIRGVSVRVAAFPITVLAILGIGAVAITPALAGRIVPQTRSVNDPSWWRQAATWLGRHDGEGRALVVPGAAQPVYLWGSPRDDALQPVADGPWTVRDGAPMAQPGYVRLLDEIETRLAQGRADTTMAAVLARAGIGYVVVRNDLDSRASGATPLPFVRATLANSPGLRKVATFGPDVVPPADPDRLIDLGLTTPAGAVLVYAVSGAGGRAEVVPSAQTVRALGSADELPALVDRGLAKPDTPVIFGAADEPAGHGPLTVVTDGIRRREAAFSAVNQKSATMTAGEPFRATRKVHDYLPSNPGRLSTIRYIGISGVSASSSGSNTGARVNRSPATSPWAALDNDPVSAWRSGGLHAEGQWWQVDFGRQIPASTVAVSFATSLPSYPTRLRITTSAGSRDVDVAPDPLAQTLELPVGRTQFLRLTALSVQAGPRFGSFGLADVSIPGILPSRTLELGAVGSPDVLAFDVAAGVRAGCLTVDDRAACDPSFAAAGEEDGALDRGFTLNDSATYGLAADITLSPGSELDTLLDAGQPIAALASSVDSADPRERPGAAVDGRAATSWVAAAGDVTPTLTLKLRRARLLRGLTLATDDATPASRPTRVQIRAGTGLWTGVIPADGHISFPVAVRAREVNISVLETSLRQTTSSLTGTSRLLPVGISEVRLDAIGLRAAPTPQVLTVPCSAGLGVWVDTTYVRLGLTASRDAVLAGRPVLAVPCGRDQVSLGAGVHRLQLIKAPLAGPASLTLTRIGATLPHSTGSTGNGLNVLTWGATDRKVSVTSADASVLVVHENMNAGWQATFEGRRLRPIMVDGWQQGWQLPAGTSGTVHLTFTPQRGFGIGLIIGLLAVLGLIGLAFKGGHSVRPACTDRRFGPVVKAVVVVVATTALAGFAGLLVGALCIGVLLRAPRLPAWSVAVPLCIAGLLEAWHPAGSASPLASSSAAQLLCAASVAILLAARIRPRQGRENLRSSGLSIPNQDAAATITADPAVSR